MNLAEQLHAFLVQEKITSAKDEVKISVSIGDINRKKSRLSRRYLVTRKSEPLLMARFIPKDWPFSPEDILRTYSVYGSLHSIKIPRLIGTFPTNGGVFFLEEYLKSAVTMSALIETNELDPRQGLSILKDIFSEIWDIAESPSQKFIREEKEAYKKYLTSFVNKGIFGDFVVDYVEKVIDQYSGILKQAWSTGDLMDRNILRSGKDWYLVDFEYSHKTLFLFKEAFRNIHYSKWALGFSLREVFPGLGDFPEDVAKLLSLCWDQSLQYQIVENRSHEFNLNSLRRTFWGVFDSSLPSRLDKESASLEALLHQAEAQAVQLRNENQMQKRLMTEKDGRFSQMQEESRAHLQIIQKLQRESEEKTLQVDQLKASIRVLDNALAESESRLAKSRNAEVQHEKLLALKDQDARNLREEIRRGREQIAQLRTQIQNRERSVAEKDKRIGDLRLEVDRIHDIQQVIYSSGGFKVLKSFWRLKDMLLAVIIKKKGSDNASGYTHLRSIQTVVIPDQHSSTPLPALEESSPFAGKAEVFPTMEISLPPKDSRMPEVRIPFPGDERVYHGAYLDSLDVAHNKRGDEYVPLSNEKVSFLDSQVRLIAFYLPQFHPIPENDAWWGKGFTEWRNVSKAVPQFKGHYQPHLPGELGFYDLRVPEVQRRQVELAKNYGIHGFCFHYYWFNGRRLLERPLDQFVSDPEIDFPFCICWANENWTRRWDGQENDILMKQVHSEETDLAFIKDIIPLLSHKNYIRVNGRPMLVIYRVGLMPNAAATAVLWKKCCKEAGIEEPYLVAAQSFGFIDPREVGFDAAVEFPPHNIQGLDQLTKSVKLLNPEFQGNVVTYQSLAAKMKEYNTGQPFIVFKTVSPAWDNEPRKPGKGHVYGFSTPELYKSWLDTSCNFVMQNPSSDERLVFINAWNEWGEGAHLEPDARYGYAYLDATKQIVKKYIHRPLKVSVIIPNFNREAYIARRLDSIIHQTNKPDEIIFLDDASTDKSLELAEQMLKSSPIPYRIIHNKINSGSVFKQWLKGIEEATGDLIWICENDDDADTNFLRSIIPAFHREDVMLAYGDISYINSDGSKNDGLAKYYHELSQDRWKTSHIRTANELFSGDFAIQNVIPNASGAVFRKPILRNNEIKRLLSYKFAGDWYFYALISRGGSVSFCKEAKSYFRLHQASTSRQSFFTQQHVEEHQMVLEDLQALYGLPEETVIRHAAELHRVLSLCGTTDHLNSQRSLLKSIRPANEKEKLKICIASYGFGMGGGELVPITLANHLRDLGHQITFLIMDSNMQEGSFSFRDRLRSDIPVVVWQDCFSTFHKFTKDFGFDVINSHNVKLEHNLFSHSIVPDVPYVATLHGGYETVPHLLTKDFISFLSRIVNVWLFLAEKNYTSLVDSGLKGGRFLKTFNAIGMSIPTVGRIITLREKLQLPKESIVLVLASRAIFEKGWHIAIDVTERLRKKTGQDVHLVLIGDGEDMQAIQEKATNAPYIHFVGRLENVGSMIQDCDCGIFPSTYVGESFPMFILECFAAGLPVVASDVGAIREMSMSEAGEVAGALITPRQDAELMATEMTEAIDKLFLNQKALASAKLLARKRADHYHIGKLVDQYLEIFHSVSKRKSV